MQGGREQVAPSGVGGGGGAAMIQNTGPLPALPAQVASPVQQGRLGRWRAAGVLQPRTRGQAALPPPPLQTHM